MITKKDYLLISIIGLLIGLLVLPVLININFSLIQINLFNSVLIVVVFVILANIGLKISSILSSKIPIILQIAKFAAVGGLNTLIDLGVLNLLIFLFLATQGIGYAVFKGISFIIANINSYFWNKHWTFGSGQSANVKEFGQFFVVSIIGFAINIGIASFVVNIISFGGMSPERWANIGALTATVASLIWNFLGYKFIVFKNKNLNN